MGYAYRLGLYERIKILTFFRDTLEFFLSEIRFCGSTLPQCCYLAMFAFEEPYSRLFEKVDRVCNHTLNPGYAPDFSHSFSSVFTDYFQKSAVHKKDISDFLAFLNGGVMKEEEAQILKIEQSIEKLEQNIKVAEEDAGKRGKLMMTLGVAGGLFLSVILI